MNPRLPAILLSLLLAALANAATAPEKLWQPAPAPPQISSPTNRLAVPPEIAARADWKLSFITRSGDAWLGSASRLALRQRGKWRELPNQFGGEAPIAFAETADARLWCATENQVWHFDGRNWLAMKSAPAKINSLLASSDGSLWVATQRGLLRLTRNGWLLNDTTDGLAADDVLAIVEDEVGNVFAEAAKGWSRFEPEADTDAPSSEILSTELVRANIPEDRTITVRFLARDKQDQTAQTNLLHSWRLDDREWSPFQSDTRVIVSGLGLGAHTFQVRAMDRNGNAEILPATLEFNIVVPWHRETRLVAVLALALVVSIFFATLALNRHRRLKHSYAEVERLVAERTRELELANRELLHSQKMNALGSLAAGIAHDFNNILSIIKGSAQIIEDNAGNPDKIRTRVDRIKTVVQQGAEVVEAMLGFSRSTDAPPAPCDINAVVTETRKLLGDRFLRETEVEFQPGETLPKISVTRDFVQQILLNFIFNAAEAMERGATGSKHIILKTRTSAALPKELALAPAPAPLFVLISVRDNGCGIAPEIKPRIFEPFFTTKSLSARRGTGLGLSMVYELAKKLGAGLAVDSSPGAGSEFTLILPAKP